MIIGPSCSNLKETLLTYIDKTQIQKIHMNSTPSFDWLTNKMSESSKPREILFSKISWIIYNLKYCSDKVDEACTGW